MDISALINGLLTILGFFGLSAIILKKVSGLAKYFGDLTKEMSEAFMAIVVASQDGKITADEIATITKESKDVWELLKKIKNAISSK